MEGKFGVVPVPVIVTTKRPTKRPTRRPIRRPTRSPTYRPTIGPTRRPTTPASNQGQSKISNPNCKPKNHVCFNRNQYDAFCCSQRCGNNGRCVANTTGNNNAAPATPTPRPTRRPTPYPVVNTIHGKSDVSLPCVDSSQIKLTVEIQTDKYGDDLGWSLERHPYGPTLRNVPNGTYGLYAYDKYEDCVPRGHYNLTVTDRYGDGICCFYGEGYVKVHIEGREVMNVIFQQKVLSELLNVGYDPTPSMTQRDRLYLRAHNRRRADWFGREGASNVPLKWSPMLAEESRAWAEKLLVNCSVAGIEHEPGVAEGENLAKNTGTMNAQGLGWGQVRFIVSFFFGCAHVLPGLWLEQRKLNSRLGVSDSLGFGLNI